MLISRIITYRVSERSPVVPSPGAFVELARPAKAVNFLVAWLAAAHLVRVPFVIADHIRRFDLRPEIWIMHLTNPVLICVEKRMSLLVHVGG